ncbi:MAG: hypothetical protein QOG23_127 [Blastocatellia bacterium]|jgi:hypothetical protein|nr:hypothetical protein [Blastocatellia bacterium]
MADTDFSHDTIFQFAVLRDPQKHPSDALERRFIRFNWNLAHNAEEAGHSSLMIALKNLRATGEGSLPQMISAAVSFFTTNPNAVQSVEKLFTVAHDFTKVNEWLLNSERGGTVTDLRTKLEETARMSLVDYCSSNLDALNGLLWENLVANMIAQRDPYLRQELINLIRMNWIAARLRQGDPQLKNGQDMYEGARATVLLPAEIFPLPPPSPIPINRTTGLQHAMARTEPRVPMDSMAQLSTAASSQSSSGTMAEFSSASHVSNATGSQMSTSAASQVSTSAGKELVRIGGVILEGNRLPSAPVSVSAKDRAYARWPQTRGKVKPSGIADFKAVQTQLLMYAKGEIATIENVMKGEKNSHVVRTFDRREEVTMRDVETITQTEAETQTNDKSELSRESSEILKEDLKLDVGVKLSANFGPVSIQASTGFSYQNSKEKTNKVATKLAKDVMNRAVNRITQRVRTQTTVTRIHETEDTVTHSLENTSSSATSAMYRWVDKYYLARLVNYGPRLMFDFIVPEPAAFYVFSVANAQVERSSVRKPKPPWEPTDDETLLPRTGLKSFRDISLQGPGSRSIPRFVPALASFIEASQTEAAAPRQIATVAVGPPPPGPIAPAPDDSVAISTPPIATVVVGPPPPGNVASAEAESVMTSTPPIAAARFVAPLLTRTQPESSLESASTIVPRVGREPLPMREKDPAPTDNDDDNTSAEPPLGGSTAPSSGGGGNVGVTLPAVESNWERWAAVYGVQDLEPPPPEFVTVGTSFARYIKTGDDDTRFTQSGEDKLAVPTNYKAVKASIACTFYANKGIDDDGTHAKNFIEGQVGSVPFSFVSAADSGKTITTTMMGETAGVVPISFRSDTKYFAMNVELKCQRTQEALDQWRIKTFNAIMAGYEAQKAAYDAWLKSQEVSSGVVIPGHNPDMNREVESEELKKSCIELLTGQRFESFDAIRSQTSLDGNGPSQPQPPEFDFDETIEEGKYIRFFEDAFEWPLMAYIFYPYFWGRKPNWVTVKQLEDPDPLFTKFLQAGAARVLVPVRRNYWSAISDYLTNGQIWQGGDVPGVDDPLYVSIADEMKEAAGHFKNEGVVEEWVVKVPTNFVMIDDPNNPLTLPDNRAALKFAGSLDEL